METKDDVFDGRCCVYKSYNFRECTIDAGRGCVYQCKYGEISEVCEFGECEREFRTIVDPVTNYSKFIMFGKANP